MCKFDFFKANKELANRMTDYVNAKVDNGCITYYYGTQISALNNSIASQEKLRDSIIGDGVDSVIDGLRAQVADLESKRDNELAQVADWNWTDDDKVLYKAYKVCDDEKTLASAMIVWFNKYVDDGSFADVELCYELIHAIGWTDPKSNKALVKDICKNGDNAALDKKKSQATFLKSFYNKVATILINKGTVKLKNVSDLARKVWEEEEAARNQKKAQNKAKKTA